MKVTVTRTSRATYTSTESVTTLEELIEGGWDIDEDDVYELEAGGIFSDLSPNGMNKIVVTKF